ncbi:hypothetical protein RHMOL_Rhmol11G0144500 [Rhododendron molle]|uniref:Uncharacterized protein n=2 Tax=Rhododendron molle TaxID=49168 RepID=A0ACC0LSQ1_RHOML|nr:hypothetical protein RHMOL_Rhmol11G0144500 [Rhododendron molle]KAI8531541.1 hypothetical protein RHMOL_Rhmol11G0144500 [Rhododendron molle]
MSTRAQYRRSREKRGEQKAGRLLGSDSIRRWRKQTRRRSRRRCRSCTGCTLAMRSGGGVGCDGMGRDENHERGPDTRKKFTDHLNNALTHKGYRTFRDNDEIERGEPIKSELQKAIGDSKIFVIVLSKNYAKSTACMFELQMILEQWKKSDHFILPVFYEVDPLEVKKQAKHLHFRKKEVTHEKVKGWSAALEEVAGMAGMVSQNQCNGLQRSTQIYWAENLGGSQTALKISKPPPVIIVSMYSATLYSGNKHGQAPQKINHHPVVLYLITPLTVAWLVKVLLHAYINVQFEPIWPWREPSSLHPAREGTLVSNVDDSLWLSRDAMLLNFCMHMCSFSAVYDEIIVEFHDWKLKPETDGKCMKTIVVDGGSRVEVQVQKLIAASLELLLQSELHLGKSSIKGLPTKKLPLGNLLEAPPQLLSKRKPQKPIHNKECAVLLVLASSLNTTTNYTFDSFEL